MTTKLRFVLATFSVCAAIPLLAMVLPAAAQDFDEVEIRRIDLGGGLAMLMGAGGNIGVSAGPDGVFLIDDQYAPLSEKIRAAVTEISDRPIRFVVNTHWHSDHTGGNEAFGDAGAVIVAHDNVRRRMSVDQVSTVWSRTVPASPAGALPVITFAESVSFHLNGQEVHVVHVGPAHTDGDAIVHWPAADVIHTGDVFVNGLYPFVDLDSGGDLDGMITALDEIRTLVDADTRIIPGHGPLGMRSDLDHSLAMLKTVRQRVAEQIAAGQSVDAVLAAKPTAEFDAEFGNGFLEPEQFVRFVYASLSQK